MIVPITVRDVFATNCYFYIDDESKHGFLVDCGAQGEAVAQLAMSRGWTIDALLLTHGHFDHTAGVGVVQRLLGVPVYIHEADARYLTDTQLNLSALCGRDVSLQDVNLIADGHTLPLQGNASAGLTAIHTPGHTPGSCTYYSAAGQVAFVGDTIFRDQPGTSQYKGGVEADLQSSIARLLRLPAATTLCSGHSQPTTVGHELNNYIK